jgi:hypothetical protein
VALLMKGDAQAALTEAQRESDESWHPFGLTMVYHTLGRKADSDAVLAETVTKYASRRTMRSSKGRRPCKY